MIEQKDSRITFNSVYKSEYCPDDQEIQEANLLILPYKSFRNGVDYCFTEYGEEFIQYVRDKNLKEVKADIAITDDKYRVIEMHSLLIDIGIILLTNVIVPVAIGLVTNYVYDKIKSLHVKEDDVNIRFEIISQNASGESKSIRYDGPASGFDEVKETAEKMIEQL